MVIVNQILSRVNILHNTKITALAQTGGTETNFNAGPFFHLAAKLLIQNNRYEA